MADLAHRTAGRDQGTAIAPAVEPEGEELGSNAANAEALEGQATGLENYQAALGTWLGGELYGAVSPHLTLESLSGYAKDGLNGALAGLVDQLKNVGEADDKAIEAFGEALANRYDDLAEDWMKEHGGGIADALSGWVDAHPKTIVAVALLAAAGAVAADLDIPELEADKEFGDGFKASGGVKLGSLRNIALEQIKAKLEYKSGPLIAAMQVTHETEGGTSGTVSAGYGDNERRVDGRIKVAEDGIEAWGLSGLYSFGDGYSARGSVTGEDGKEPKINASLTHKDGETVWSSGLDYDANTGLLKLNGKYDTVFGDGYSGGGSAHVNSEGDFGAEVHGKYESDERTIRGSAGYESNTNTTSLDLSYDERLNEDWRTRVRQQVQLSDGAVEYETTGLAAYQIDRGVQIFGGGSWKDDAANGGRFIPEIGAQIDDVPISLRYDTATETISVGIQLKF